MTDTEFSCPYCRRSLQVNSQEDGMTVQCPGCGSTVRVPPALNTPAPSQPSDQRPTSVTVFGILNIVFGSLGLLCSPFGFIGVFTLPDTFNPTLLYKGWLLFSAFIGLALSVWLLSMGIGLLNLKRWARVGSIAYGWFTIIWGIIGMIINFYVLFGQKISSSPEEMPALIGGAFGGIFGGVIGLVYPILLIVFMKKPAAVNSCTR
jgi:hypothetical protein